MNFQEEKDLHRKWALQLFNETWDLIEKKDRTGDEDSQMLEKAYSSLYHWRQVGTKLNLVRGFFGKGMRLTFMEFQVLNYVKLKDLEILI